MQTEKAVFGSAILITFGRGSLVICPPRVVQSWSHSACARRKPQATGLHRPPGRMLASAPSQPRSAVPAPGELLRREPAPIRRRRWNCILQRPGFRGALARGAPRSASNPRSISKFVSFFSLSLAGRAGLWLAFLLDVPLSRASRIGRDLIGTWGPSRVPHERA